MDAKHPGLSALRARLAFRLGVKAACGIALVLLMAIAMLAGATLAFVAGFLELAGGNPLRGLGVWFGAALLLHVGLMTFGWLRFTDPPPSGVLLEREAAPTLFDLIERVGKHFPGARVDSVWITGDMNALVTQRPAWGMFGPMRTSLLIGLPLAHSVSDRQLAAVLAHEFGHLVHQRSGLGAWNCHLRGWWFRVLDRIALDLPWLTEIVDLVSRGMVVEAIRLSHLEEFEADRAAARVAGSALIGETLVEVALKDRFLTEDFMCKVMAQSRVRSAPSIRPYREMGLGMSAGFRRPIPEGKAVSPESVVSGAGGEADLHPALPDRLLAVGTSRVVLRGDESSAAENHLSQILPSLSLSFDRAWWADTRNDWRRQYRRVRRRARVAKLDTASSMSPGLPDSEH